MLRRIFFFGGVEEPTFLSNVEFFPFKNRISTGKCHVLKTFMKESFFFFFKFDLNKQLCVIIIIPVLLLVSIQL